MPTTTTPSTPPSGRASARDRGSETAASDGPTDEVRYEGDEDVYALDDVEYEPSPAALAAAGLIGAALGAGIGLLLSRSTVDGGRGPVEQARRGVARAGRDVGRGVERAGRQVRRRSAAAADDTREALAEALRALGRTREELGDRIERELRHLRKLTRRGRRRGWLR